MIITDVLDASLPANARLIFGQGLATGTASLLTGQNYTLKRGVLVKSTGYKIYVGHDNSVDDTNGYVIAPWDREFFPCGRSDSLWIYAPAYPIPDEENPGEAIMVTTGNTYCWWAM